jgi:hypothetical protein
VALFGGLSLVKSDLLARGGVMTMTLMGNFDALSSVECVRLVLVAKLASVPSRLLCSMMIGEGACIGFRPISC